MRVYTYVRENWLHRLHHRRRSTDFEGKQIGAAIETGGGELGRQST